VTLAETCAKCERYIGTEGGGMDQSISFLGEEGTVSHVYFIFVLTIYVVFDLFLKGGCYFFFVYMIKFCFFKYNKKCNSYSDRIYLFYIMNMLKFIKLILIFFGVSGCQLDIIMKTKCLIKMIFKLLLVKNVI